MYYEPQPSCNFDSVPSFPIQRGNIFGAKCPITSQEFLNLSETGDPPRLTVDPSKTMSQCVAAQKSHTHAIAYTQDTINGVFTPRNRSIVDRKALWESEQ